MSIPKRHANVAGTYLVTSRTWQSRALFKIAQPCEIFLELLLKYRDEGRYRLHQFVLMPDHFHALLTPTDNVTIERALQFIKGGSARAIREKLFVRFPIWQRGFTDHRIRDRADYNLHVQYIAQNPVKKNLASDAGGYRWSSASGVCTTDAAPERLEALGIAVGTARILR